MKQRTDCHATPRHATPRHATPRHATPRHARYESHAASSVRQHLARILKPSFRSLLFLLAAGMFLFSCKDDEPERSSEASITSLTLTVEDTDYAITFTNKQGKIRIPYATELPATATVKAVVLSAKATGIKVGDKITLPASGTVTLTVTAEDDKTKGVYTLTVEKEAEIVTVSATETAKRKPTDVRDSYGIFTLKTNTNTVTDYHLAVKEKSATAPTADEMKKSALKRNISTDAIHVLIAQRLNAPMVDFAEKYFANTDQQDLGTGMGGSFYTDRALGVVRDATATGSDAWVKESVLKPSTGYTLYGMTSGGTTVDSLLSFTTDSVPAHGSKATSDQPVLADSTLEQGYITLSIRADEYYLFPMQTDGTDTSPISFQVRSSHQIKFVESLNIFLLNNSIATGSDSVFVDFLLLLTGRNNDKRDYYTGLYILTRPMKAQQISSQDAWNYNISAGIGATLLQPVNFSTLSIQE